MDKVKSLKVVHLEKGGQHYYYGSVTAMFEHWTAEELGVNYRKLRDMRGYTNDKCVIRVGQLIVSSARQKVSKRKQ